MTATALHSRERLADFRAAFLPAVVSRVACSILIVAVASVGKGLTWSGFVAWDGAWYTSIATVGYSGTQGPPGQEAWPFFPLLPGLLRLIRLTGLPMQFTGVILCNLAFWVALAGVYRIARRHTSERAATYAVWALALFPASTVFSMLYPSSFFLAASVWAFVWVEERHDLAAAAAVVVAALTRPNGAVVALALVVALWRAPKRLVLVIGPTALAIALWMLYCWQQTGDPLIFLATKQGWAEVTIWDAVSGGMKWAALPHLVLAVAALGAVIVKRKQLPASWTALTLLQLLPSLVLGMVGLGRYANECFPPFVAAGDILVAVPRPWRIAAFVAAGAGLALFTLAVIRYSLVP